MSISSIILFFFIYIIAIELYHKSYIVCNAEVKKLKALNRDLNFKITAQMNTAQKIIDNENDNAIFDLYNQAIQNGYEFNNAFFSLKESPYNDITNIIRQTKNIAIVITCRKIKDEMMREFLINNINDDNDIPT